jgi:hypothetical protein
VLAGVVFQECEAETGGGAGYENGL